MHLEISRKLSDNEISKINRRKEPGEITVSEDTPKIDDEIPNTLKQLY